MWDAGCRVQGAGFRVQGAGCRVQGAGLKVQGSGFRVQGPGCGVYRVALRARLDQRFLHLHSCRNLQVDLFSFGGETKKRAGAEWSRVGGRYRGTSLIRNTHPPRIAIGP